MFQIRQDSLTGKVYWEEECHCSPPLAMERTAVLDQYFTEINAAQSSEVKDGRLYQSYPSYGTRYTNHSWKFSIKLIKMPGAKSPGVQLVVPSTSGTRSLK
jgi:hypothetical protein